MSARGPIYWLVGAVVVGSTVQCSRPTDTVLDCSAAEIHHVLRIHATGAAVDDLSATPPKQGRAEVSDTVYVLRFLEKRDNYELVFQIDRATGRGTRQLFDDEQQAIRGHGGSDAISCQPYTGRL